MKKQPKKKKKSNSRMKSNTSLSHTESWVDKIEFVPMAGKKSNGDDEESTHAVDVGTISIVSWNILAETYCRPTSHPNLPDAKIVFDRSKRRRLMFAKLQDLCGIADIICLQEVDIDVKTKLKTWGFTGVETPTTRSGGGSGCRVDACGVYVRIERYEIVQTTQVAFDDLASLNADESADEKNSKTAPDDPHTDNTDVTSKKKGSHSAAALLTMSLGQDFLRRNVGILVRLRDKCNDQTYVVANSHLYWNPGFEYVKLCQTHYMLVRARAFLQNDEPFLFAGDLNSRPHGAVHSYLTNHGIRAKKISPWYNFADVDADLPDLNRLTLDDASSHDEVPMVRYILDFTLNKLCRWLRIMGIDAILESEEEEKERTGSNSNFGILFEKARAQGRVLVTTSVRLMQRRDCPAGAYCLHPSSLGQNIEVALVHMLRTHGVVIEPACFLSRCVVCNGKISAVDNPDRQREILQEYSAPVLTDLKVWECEGCHQGYWWCDHPTSSASRVKSQAMRLLQICIQGGIPLHGHIPKLFDHLDVSAEKKRGWDYSQAGSELLRYRLTVMDWLAKDWLECPFELESVYVQRDESEQISGESIPFTNVTDSFVNVLDYIYYPTKSLKLVSQLHVPASFKALNTKNVGRGHLLPNQSWPSDHLAIGAVFEASTSTDLSTALPDHVSPQNDGLWCSPSGGPAPPPVASASILKHPRRCDCGCIPKNIPSLFEMAELRRQARLKSSESND